MELKKEDLLEIEGGIDLSSALLNAFAKIFNLILDIGRNLGTSFRRISNGELCPLE